MNENSAFLLDLYPPPKGDYRLRTLPVELLKKSPDGKIDFRGCKLLGLAKVIVEDADFSNISSAERGTRIFILSSIIRRSLFESSGPFSRLSGSFYSCTFHRTRVKKSHVVGFFASCTFENVDFSEALLSGNFEHCIFENCNLDVDALSSGFKDCIFIGCSFASWLGGKSIPVGESVTLSVKSGHIIFNEYIKFHNEPASSP